jgi:hypothetical protein
MSNHELQWTVYEANVQAYRSSFNSSQALLLAFGWVINTSDSKIPPTLIILISILAVIQIWYVWFRVIHTRTLIADYHKIFIDPKYTIPAIDIGESVYVKCPVERKAFNLAAGMSSNWRLSRIKMDIFLPLLYTFIWLVLLFYSKHIGAIYQLIPSCMKCS